MTHARWPAPSPGTPSPPPVEVPVRVEPVPGEVPERPVTPREVPEEPPAESPEPADHSTRTMRATCVRSLADIRTR